MKSTWSARTDLSRRGALAYLGAGGLGLALTSGGGSGGGAGGHDG